MHRYRNSKNEVIIESLGKIGVSGLFCFSILFFNIFFSRFTIGVLVYVFLLLANGLLGIIAGNTENQKILSVFKLSTYISLLSTILLSGFCFYLIIDMIFIKSIDCNDLTEGDCSSKNFYFFVLFLIFYIGITASIIANLKKMLFKTEDFISILTRRNMRIL